MASGEWCHWIGCRRQMFRFVALREFKRVSENTIGTAARENTDLRNHLMFSAFILNTTNARIFAFDILADDQSNSCHSKWMPCLLPAASITRIPSGMISVPIPSPGISATLIVVI